jgi:hypothetical protein
MSLGTHVRLCLKDLYAQDIVEMIERETRKYEVEAIEHPDHPDFKRAFQMLWDAFGPAGEMESEEVIREMMLEDSTVPMADAGFARFFLLVARDRATGAIRGVRDGRVFVNQHYDADLCVIYLSHIFMAPEARGTVLTYWLRIAPMDLAITYLHLLHARGRIALPAPDAPHKHYGMRIDLAAEVEYFSPEDKLSLQRLLFYGRGGFDAIDPRHFPYRQPDFRPPAEIAATGDRPHPFMLLLRRVGREREARLPIEEARAVMRLLYDDFETFCEPANLASSLDVVLSRLDERERAGKKDVALLPLPTGASDLRRLKALFRYDVYRKYYGAGPATADYLASETARAAAASPHWIEEQIAAHAAQLGKTARWVYASREKGFDPEAPAEPPPVPMPGAAS